MKILLQSVLFLLLTSVAYAANFCEGLIHVQFAARVEEAASKIQPGTLALLSHPSLDEEQVTRFLGRVQSPDGSGHSYLFYDTAAQEIHVIPAKRLVLSDSQTSALKNEQTEVYVRSDNQEGATCGAYSLYNCIRQIGMKAEAPAKVRAAISNEAARVKLLMKAVNRIYLDRTPGEHFIETVESLAAEHDLSAKVHSTQSVDLFKNGILDDLKAGWPVIVRFDVTSEMQKTEYTLVSHEAKQVEHVTRDLWIPTSDRTRSAGSHAVALLATFEAKQEQFVLVSDPNWNAPRIWPASYLERMTSANMAAWTVKLK